MQFTFFILFLLQCCFFSYDNLLHHFLLTFPWIPCCSPDPSLDNPCSRYTGMIFSYCTRSMEGPCVLGRLNGFLRCFFISSFSSSSTELLQTHLSNRTLQQNPRTLSLSLCSPTAFAELSLVFSQYLLQDFLLLFCLSVPVAL